MSETFSCPACQSVIATDGRALRQRSSFLEDLIETANDVPKLEQRLNELEAEAAKPARSAVTMPAPSEKKKKAARKKVVKKKVSNKKTEVRVDEVQLGKGSEAGTEGSGSGGTAGGEPEGGDFFDEL